MDAAVFRAEFNYPAALTAAQSGRDAGDVAARLVPSAEILVSRAREIIEDEDRLSTLVDASGALDRFAEDRVQSINPVIVSGFVEQAARTLGWEFSEAGPFPGIRVLRSRKRLPEVFGGGFERLIAADGRDLTKAKGDLFGRASDVLILGPTEEPFREMVSMTFRETEADLVRGAAVVDTGSISSYTLFVFVAEIERHDGVSRRRERIPLLIRFSGDSAFEIQWPTVMKLRPSSHQPAPPPPAARLEAAAAANATIARYGDDAKRQQVAIAAKGREQLDESERRHRSWVRGLDPERRQEAVDRLSRDVDARRRQLAEIEQIATTPPRLMGWVSVTAGALTETLGYDPDSERVAVARVVDELGRLGWDVDDRQTAGLGYDLLARHKESREQRLVEVKGLIGDINAITLEQHEWAQAQQRGEEYWLYVVTHCADAPRVALRLQNPAGALAGPRSIERFTIPVSQLRPFMEGA
jgi:hypothetical protein